MLNKIPCFIISYNRPSFLKRCVEALANEDRIRLIIIDNNSDSPEMIEYLNQLHEAFMNGMHGESALIIKTKYNEGHKVLWKGLHSQLTEINDPELFKTLIGNQPYIVTDCDIIVPEKLPWLDVLLNGMNRLPQYNKFGLGLNTRHIPDSNKQKAEILHHENHIIYKRTFGDHRFIEKPVDTTLALYRAGYTNYSIWGNESELEFTGVCKAVRTVAPYEAMHLTWQMTPEEIAGDENQNYLRTINKNSTHWSERK